MNEELSPKMVSAIKHMARNGNKVVRYPGGYWASEHWHAWSGPCFGTPTIEAIVRRGYAEYTVWKDGRASRFPIECGLTQRALDSAPPYTAEELDIITDPRRNGALQDPPSQ